MLYPVLDLRRRGLGVKQYVHILEQSCIDLLAGMGLRATRRCSFPGVWLGDGKVAALGVRVAHGTAYHGMALNVDVNEIWFAAIQPCGLRASVVSLASQGVSESLSEMAAEWYDSLSTLLQG
jgi:lipoyl(octanoyl) transferase